MSEDFDIREEELKFVAQPYLFEPQEPSKLTILLHPVSYITSEDYSFGASRLAHSAYGCPPEASYLNL